MARSVKWKLRERDNRANAQRTPADVLSARIETPAGDQAVGSRLTGPQGVGAPSVTGEDVPASPAGGAGVRGRARRAQPGPQREETVAEPKELDNAE